LDARPSGTPGDLIPGVAEDFGAWGAMDGLGPWIRSGGCEDLSEGSGLPGELLGLRCGQVRP
jgi:hypothetical protein